MGKVTKYATEEFGPGRDYVFKQARQQVMKASRGKYPSPLKIIDVLEESAKKGFGSEAGFKAEREAFGSLGMTPESKSLVSIFFGQTACKKNPYGAPEKKVEKVAVLGESAVSRCTESRNVLAAGTSVARGRQGAHGVYSMGRPGAPYSHS